jgi:glycosyltransferase 2 family protein
MSFRLPRRSRLLINLATVAVTIFFSYVALSGIKLAQVSHALASSDYLWLIPALVAFGLGNLARALRWRSLFARGRRPGRSVVLNATMIGYFYNSILPARAGEAARVLVLSRRSPTAPVEILGTVVLERVYDVVTILVIFFVTEPWLPHVSWFGAAALAAIVLAGLIAAAVTVLAVYGDRPLRLLLGPLRRLPWFSAARFQKTIDELTHGLSGLRHGTVALEAFMWSVTAWLLSALCAYFVSVSFHLHLSFACGVLVVVAVGLSMILPSPPSAIGVFEGAALIALKAYGISHSQALPYALVLHAVNFVPFVLIGVLLLHHNARRPAGADGLRTRRGRLEMPVQGVRDDQEGWTRGAVDAQQPRIPADPL